MRALILGATGFIGTAVREQMLQPDSGLEPIPVSRTGGRDGRGGWVALDPAAQSPAEIRAVLDDSAVDVVVNCAGVVAGDQRALVDGNVRSLLNLVEAVSRMSNPSKIVQVGSGAEYGEGAVGQASVEEDPARPRSPYGRTKLLATELVMTGVATHGLDGVVLRVFNPIGPGSPQHTLAGIAARKIRDALRSGSSDVELGPLDAFRDFVDVRDVARAITAACTRSGLAGEILNVGSGRAVTARALVAAIVTASGYGGAVVEVDGGSPRSASVSWQQADLTRVRRTLGWEPRIDMDRSALDLWQDLTVDGEGWTATIIEHSSGGATR